MEADRSSGQEPCPWRLGVIVSYLGSLAVLFAFWMSQVVEWHAELELADASKIYDDAAAAAARSSLFIDAVFVDNLECPLPPHLFEELVVDRMGFRPSGDFEWPWEIPTSQDGLEGVRGRLVRDGELVDLNRGSHDTGSFMEEEAILGHAGGSGLRVLVFHDCGASTDQFHDMINWDGEASGSVLWTRANLSAGAEGAAARVKELLLTLMRVSRSLKNPLSVDNWIAAPSILSELKRAGETSAVASRDALAIIKFWMVNMDKACPKLLSRQEVAQHFLHPAAAAVLGVESRLEVVFNVTAYGKEKKTQKRHPEDAFPWMELGSRGHTGMDVTFKTGWAPPVLDVIIALSLDPPEDQMLERQGAVILNFDGSDCGGGANLTNETLLAMGQKVAASLRQMYGLPGAVSEARWGDAQPDEWWPSRGRFRPWELSLLQLHQLADAIAATGQELGYLKATYESVTQDSLWWWGRGLTFGRAVHEDVGAHLQQALDHAKAIVRQAKASPPPNNTLSCLIREFARMKRAVHLASTDGSLLPDGSWGPEHYIGVYLPIAFTLLFQGANLLKRELLLRSKEAKSKNKSSSQREEKDKED